MIKIHNVVNKVKNLKKLREFLFNFSAQLGKDYYLSKAQIKQKIDELIASGNLSFKFPVDNQKVSKILKSRNNNFMQFNEKMKETV